MDETLVRTLLYGLVAAASPLALAATAVVLRSRRPHLNGAIFAGSFLVGSFVVVLVALAIGSAATPGRGGSGRVATLLELLLGALLLAAAPLIGRAPVAAEDSGAGRTQALLARLARLSPATALSAGALLGIGGPKRLTVGILAATTISAADLTTRQNLVASAVYVIVASVLVWVPVAAYFAAGRRVQAWLARLETWLTANQRVFATISLLVVGVILVGDALVRLL